MLKYRRCIALLRVIFVLLEVSVFLREGRFAHGILIAKSDLTVCDSVGQNPHNVVDNKSCQKKLIIAQAVRSGQVRSAKKLSRSKPVQKISSSMADGWRRLSSNSGIVIAREIPECIN